MNEEKPQAEKKDPLDGKRIKLSKAYLRIVEQGISLDSTNRTYGLYRDTLQGEPKVANPDPHVDEDYTWEKLGPPLGPLVLLREIRPGETDPRTGQPPRVAIRTVDPGTDKLLELTEVMHYEIERVK